MTFEEANEAYMSGFHDGSAVADRAALIAVATAALYVLGKDPGDGVIDLGALGRWFPADDGGMAHREGDR